MKKFTFLMAFLLINTLAHADKNMTKQFEGFSPTPYICTAGIKTIGYGFNVSELKRLNLFNGDYMTQAQADKIFDIMYQSAKNDAIQFIGEKTFQGLSDNQKNILIDLSYNMGLSTLSKFQKFKTATISGDFELASAELKNSKWYGQVGNRSKAHVKNFTK